MADRERLLRQAGHAIAGIHEARFDRPGVVTGGDADGLDLTATRWTDTLCETIEWRASDWFAERFTDLPARLVETVHDCNPTLDSCGPVKHWREVSRDLLVVVLPRNRDPVLSATGCEVWRQQDRRSPATSRPGP